MPLLAGLITRIILGKLQGALLVVLVVLAPQAHGDELIIDAAELAIAGSDIHVSATIPDRQRWSDIRLTVDGESYAPDSFSDSILSFPPVTIFSSGTYPIQLAIGNVVLEERSIRVIPGWFTVVPPALTIVVALIFRSVIPALFLGVAVGAWGVIGFTPGGLIAAVASTFETYVKNSLLHPDHATVILFTLMTAGMVGILAKNGGISGLVGVLTQWAYTPRRGMLCSTGLGLSIFFDDYATTLLVGKTMRPITDRLKISREKLAYIVDSTAAPLACIAFVTTWVGFQISLIGSSLADLPGLDLTASSILISAIGPLNRDAILALRGVQGQHRRWCFTYQGNRMEAIGSAWKRALRRAGIDKFRFHDLRHTWASWHVMSGTSLQELMELGGWKSYEMVLRYAHLAPEHLSTAAARIERELEVVTTGATISLR